VDALRACAPLTAYDATLMYLDAVGITGYQERRNATPFTDLIVLPAGCCERIDADVTYKFGLDGGLLSISGEVDV